MLDKNTLREVITQKGDFAIDFNVFDMGVILPLLAWILIWITRDKNIRSLSTQIERRRFWIHALLLVLPTIVVSMLFVFVLQEFYSNIGNDGVWHQTIVKDSETDGEIIEYCLLLIGIFLPLGAFLYAITRLPYFVLTTKIPYLVMLILWYAVPIIFLMEPVAGVSSEFDIDYFSAVILLETITTAALWQQIITYGRQLYNA